MSEWIFPVASKCDGVASEVIDDPSGSEYWRCFPREISEYAHGDIMHGFLDKGTIREEKAHRPPPFRPVENYGLSFVGGGEQIVYRSGAIRRPREFVPR
jgi:hypothetical protein